MKTILITGAGSGMGRDSAVALAKRGHRVIATTHSESSVTALQNYAKQQNCTLEVWKLDITDTADREKIRRLPLDVLINNAGVGEAGPLSEISMEKIRAVFETNVFGTLALSQIALAGMIERKNGTVLVVSSIAGRLPIPFLSPYSMTKFALSGGIAAMRAEVYEIAPQVHVSLIEPGAYDTGFNQNMMEKEYPGIAPDSPYFSLIPTLKRRNERFATFQEKSTKSIVRKIVAAAESSKPRLRYVAPWYQGLGVQLARMMGS